MLTFPNAKINLGLQITEKLPNGYHSINSCLYPIPWKDALEVVQAKKSSFTTSGINIPGNDKDNLVFKAYKQLKGDFGLPELSIHLHKAIPMGAGLGGGSADAAFMLSLLNDQFQLFLDDDLLEAYAADLGSDCPFFIRNQPALATGTGTTLSPLALDLSGLKLLVINPGIHVATKDAYARVRPKAPEHNLEEVLLSQDFDRWKKELVNDFEAGIFKLHPVMDDIKTQLYERGALYAAMSGSGSTFFGLFEHPVSIDQFDLPTGALSQWLLL